MPRNTTLDLHPEPTLDDLQSSDLWWTCWRRSYIYQILMPEGAGAGARGMGHVKPAGERSVEELLEVPLEAEDVSSHT